jgi:hypothetical protein
VSGRREADEPRRALEALATVILNLNELIYAD